MERLQGEEANGSLLSWSGLVNLVIFWRICWGLLLGVGDVGIGGGGMEGCCC